MGKADLHLHTNFSDGLHNPRDVVKAAHKAGLNIIAVTDHDTMEGAFRARDYSLNRPGLGVEVVLGEEISTVNGHVIGLFLKTFIPPRLSAKRTVELIHQQGGIAVLAHPFHPFTGRSSNFPRASDLLNEIPFDGIESLNKGEFYGSPFNAKAAKVCGEMGFAAVGSSDAHDARFVGMAYTEFDGLRAEELRGALLSRATRARCGRDWGVKDFLGYLRTAAPVLSKYSKLSSAGPTAATAAARSPIA